MSFFIPWYRLCPVFCCLFWFFLRFERWRKRSHLLYFWVVIEKCVFISVYFPNSEVGKKICKKKIRPCQTTLYIKLVKTAQKFLSHESKIQKEANQMIPNAISKMSWGFQQTRPEVRGWTSYCRYLITENVWSNFIINSTSLSLSLDPTLSCYRHPSTAEIVATGLLALHCYGVFWGNLQNFVPQAERAFVL